MLKTVRIRLKNGQPGRLPVIQFRKNKVHHLIVWELVGKGVENCWFTGIQFANPQPKTGIFGPFTPVGYSPWAAMSNRHTGKATRGAWFYQLTISIPQGGGRAQVTVPPALAEGNNPNIKNN
jgi:hypothetical protein